MITVLININYMQPAADIWNVSSIGAKADIFFRYYRRKLYGFIIFVAISVHLKLKFWVGT
jgi:hypothetical protein